MKKKTPKKIKIIQIPPEPCNLSKVWHNFTTELNLLKSEGDIQQDRLQSAPIDILPMV